MRFLPFFTIATSATALVAAAQEQQVPLADRVQGWLSKVKGYIPSPTPVVPPVQKAVDEVVQKAITPFSLSNWQSLLEPGSEPEDWLVYITGGNKSCFGRCATADKAFNVCLIRSIQDFVVVANPHSFYIGICPALFPRSIVSKSRPVGLRKGKTSLRLLVCQSSIHLLLSSSSRPDRRREGTHAPFPQGAELNDRHRRDFLHILFGERV